MSEFKLHTEINDSTREELDLYLKERELESEVEIQYLDFRKKTEKSFIIWRIVVLIYAVAHFFLGGPFDYIFFSIFGIGTLLEFIWLFSVPRWEKQSLESWREDPGQLNDINESRNND